MSIIPTEVKLSLRAIKWGLIVLLFVGTNIGSYFYGRESYEDEIAAENVEQIQEDAVDNAQSIESQINRLTRATEALRVQQAATEEAINANQEVNLDPSCSTSDDELREFNASIDAANSGLPDDGSD